MLIEQKIQEMLENRVSKEPILRKTEGIEDYTNKKIMDVTSLNELFDKYRRVRIRLETLRSYWDVSLISKIDDHLKSFLNDDEEYQKFFEENLVSYDTFESYDSKFNVFYKVIRFLEDKRCLSELSELLKFLRDLDTWDYRPFSDEALKKKLSW